MDAGVIGRDEELALARAFLGGLAAGPRALVIEGEAGIGKTAVWLSALDEAATRGCRVLRSAGEESEARLSFVGLNDLIGDTVEPFLPALPAPQRDALEVALLRRASGAGRGPEPKAVAIALRSLLVEVARVSPVVIAVDDLQWLDAATVRALAFAVRRLERHPVGVLATVRAPLRSADALGLERALGSEGFERVRLGPLSLGALGILLDRRLGYRYRRPNLVRIERVTGGNPLFALEIARALGPAPVLEPGGALPVPVSLQEAIVDRIAALPPPGRASLLVVAALSHATVELVVQASSAAGLTVAEDAGLLRVDRDRVAFTHPLYGAAIHAAAAIGRRRAVHGRLGELVSDPEERARHLALATAGPDDEVAATLELASGHARARGAWDSAAELLEQARALTSRTHADQARQRGVRAAEHHIRAGDRARARAALEEIVSEQPRDATRSDALRLLAEISYHEDSFAEAAALLDEALDGLQDRGLAIMIELSLCYVRCHHLGDVARADVHADHALAQATALGDEGLLAEALAMRVMIDFMRARRIDWSMVERALAGEDRGRLLPLQLRPSILAAQLELGDGRLADARERLTALRADRVDAGDESELALVDVWLAWLETLAGDLVAAAAYADEALHQAALTESERDRGWALTQRAFVRAHLGDAAGARADSAAASEVCEALGAYEPMLWVAAALGVLELSVGNAAAAWEAMGLFAEGRIEAGGVGPVGFLPEALEALIALGDLDRATRLLERFEDRGRELDRDWVLAAAARCRGLLSAARGDLDGARTALDQALAEHERLELTFALARTLLAQGQVRRRRREKRLARESLARALALFEQMGARLWAERARAELTRVASRATPGELTAAERRVVELAAAGLSNREIASKLFVSIHTVEAHLSHAYAKLGVRKRSQLADRLFGRA
jgi:DNA-binding CsgD family transcriptional regulator